MEYYIEFEKACIINNFQLADKLLNNYGLNIRINNDALFKKMCIDDNAKAIEYLCKKIKEYSIKEDGNEIKYEIINTKRYNLIKNAKN